MSTLKDRITAAQALAVQQTWETEPEVSWFLAAIKVTYDHTTGKPELLNVLAHFRSLTRYLGKDAFEEDSVEQIAQRLIGWIREALQVGWLVADDPPMVGPTDPHARLVDLAKARLAQLRGLDKPPFTS